MNQFSVFVCVVGLRDCDRPVGGAGSYLFGHKMVFDQVDGGQVENAQQNRMNVDVPVQHSNGLVVERHAAHLNVLGQSEQSGQREKPFRERVFA